MKISIHEIDNLYLYKAKINMSKQKQTTNNNYNKVSQIMLKNIWKNSYKWANAYNQSELGPRTIS